MTPGQIHLQKSQQQPQQMAPSSLASSRRWRRRQRTSASVCASVGNASTQSCAWRLLTQHCDQC